LAVALTATTEPALNQPLAGAIEPPADGLAVVVRKYCVVKVAVYVVEDAGAVTECDAAPASDQFAKTYWTPAAPVCVAAAMVWVEPAVHCNEQGDVQATLSTVSESPAGELATVMALVEPAVGCVSCAPRLINVPGALWLLYSVAIQSEDRATFEIRTSSIAPGNQLPPPKKPKPMWVRLGVKLGGFVVLSAVAATPLM
jgi:hypothetical protein